MPEPKERPILFSGDEVRAVLAGEKTQLRRVMKTQPVLGSGGFWEVYGAGWSDGVKTVPCMPGHSLATNCLFGGQGDRLWVRETWASLSYRPAPGTIVYRANTDDGERVRVDAPWRPSIHMPRWACRLVLEITDVRVQRLQEISEEDARAEGIRRIPHGREGVFYHFERSEPHPKNWVDPCDAFRELWDSINAKRGAGWDVNPWCWAITFKRVEA